MAYLMSQGYGDISERSKNFAQSLRPRIERCVQEVLRISGATDRTFVFADFGVADGVSSSICARSVAEVLDCTSGLPSEISIVLEDQAENDFRPVFHRIGEAMRGIKTNVVVSAVGRTFHEQCVPSDSTHFAVSMLSVQYLDNSRPVDGFQTGYSLPLLRRWHEVGRDRSALTEAERAQFDATTEKAAKDWERFLLLRAKELRVGGRLLITAAATVPHTSDDFQKYSLGIQRDLYEEWELVIRAVGELVEAGEIDKEEEQNFVVPKQFRSLEEMQAPFLAEGSPVVMAGLRLVGCEYVVNKHPNARITMCGNEDELRRFASTYRKELACYQAPLLKMVLAKSPRRTPEEVVRLTEAVFDRVERILLASGGSASVSNMPCVLEAEKVATE